MADFLQSTDFRIEVTPSGTPIQIPHRTRAEFESGLADLVTIDGVAAAVVGSSGPNTAEHRQAKVGRTLVPLSTTCSVETGEDLVTIEGKPIATERSTCRVPDAIVQFKSGVLQIEQDLVVIDGQRVLRGAG